MARELGFQGAGDYVLDREIDEEAGQEKVARESRGPKSRRVVVEQTVQMSLRMKSGVYDRFRKFCEDERRTNGDMLEEMMGVYERHMKEKYR